MTSASGSKCSSLAVFSHFISLCELLVDEFKYCSHLSFPGAGNLKMTTQNPECQAPLMLQSSALALLDLPAELLLLVASFLPNRDLKSLRLACKTLSKSTALSFKFSRVFLSANSRDIEVFRSVANHPIFREQVTEIIWDDAYFFPAPVSWENYIPYIDRSELQIDDEEACPIWFKKRCEDNIGLLRQRKGFDVDRPDHLARQQQVDAQLPLKECWEHYLKVLKDQQAVIASQGDEKAFIYGLARFPQLKRVTVTPMAHGRTFSPLYQTPTIRTFPYGFNYPIPRGWQASFTEGCVKEPLMWSEAREAYKELWRGARIVLRILSTIKDHNVSELSFDSKHFATGLNYLIFAQPCEEYNHFAAIMKRPGFHHLHLSLQVGTLEHYNSVGFTSGYLSQAISLAKEMTHIHLTAALSDSRPAVWLKEILPVQQWPKLRHIGLNKFNIDTSELIDLLGSTSPSLRSVEFGSFQFPNDARIWSGLLRRMRDELGWDKRDRSQRPAVRISMQMSHRHSGRFALLTDSVTNFLYESGDDPTDDEVLNYPNEGTAMLHDLFEPEYIRPHVDMRVLMKLGIIESW